MSARQVTYGFLGFETAEALDREVREAIASAPAIVADVLSRAHRDDCVLALDTDGSFPSAYWHAITGALAELGARAESGHVTMVYDGGGHEVVVAGPLRRRHALAAQRPSAWLPLDRDRTHELALPDAPVEDASFACVRYADGSRGLDVGDWLGIMVELIPDAGLVFARGSGHDPARVDLRQPQDMRLFAELDRPGATRLMAFEGKELVSVVRVVGSEALALRDRRVEHALAIDVEEHDIAMEAAPYLRADWRTHGRIAERRRSRRLWLERGVGIVALHVR